MPRAALKRSRPSEPRRRAPAPELADGRSRGAAIRRQSMSILPDPREIWPRFGSGMPAGNTGDNVRYPKPDCSSRVSTDAATWKSRTCYRVDFVQRGKARLATPRMQRGTLQPYPPLSVRVQQAVGIETTAVRTELCRRPSVRRPSDRVCATWRLRFHPPTAKGASIAPSR